MSSSVMFAEVFLSIFLWRLSLTLSVQVISYVDDINFMADSVEVLKGAILQLLWFSQIFSLDVSRPKSYLWGCRWSELVNLSAELGFQIRDCVSALGTEWPLHPHVSPPFEKDSARMETMLERLQRLSHLPAAIGVKASVISTGALSLLDFATKPSCEGLPRLRSAVRGALGMSSGSPEVLFGILTKGSLDPYVRWILTNLRLWHSYARQGQHELLLAVRRVRRGSRLATLVRESRKWNMELTPTEIQIDGNLFYLRTDWRELRPRILKALKISSWTQLAVRRPVVYGGLDSKSILISQHKRLLASLSPYEAKVLLRVWSGCALTRKHRFTIGQLDSPTCSCGMEDEDVPHLVSRCALLPPPTWDLLQWSLLTPVNSAALLFLEGMDSSLIPTWRRVCKRIVWALTQGAREVDVRDGMDWKGHMVDMDSTGMYTYCTGCFVTRRARDAKYIAVRPCESQGEHVREGEVTDIHGHHAKLEFSSWRLSALRPRFTCLSCESSWWATGVPRFRCEFGV